MNDDYGRIIYQALSGSRMLNLHHEDSDFDRIYIFVASTEDVLSYGIRKDRMALSIHEPEIQRDDTYWELGKAVDLLRAGNFNALPLVFPYNPEIGACGHLDMGQLFADCRSAFISQKFIHSILGYGYGAINKHIRSTKEWISILTAIETGNTLLIGPDNDRRDEVRFQRGWALRQVSIPDLILLEHRLDTLKERLEEDTSLPIESDYDRIREMMVSIRQLAYEGDYDETD